MPSKHGPKVNAFYHSARWQKVANEKWMRCRGRCEICGRVLPRRNMIIHHKVELTEENVDDPKIALNPDNLECVCHDCHNRIHFGRDEVKESDSQVFFDEKGDVIVRRSEGIPPIGK